MNIEFVKTNPKEFARTAKLTILEKVIEFQNLIIVENSTFFLL